MKPLPNYGEHMNVEDFIVSCEAGAFLDYDGHGEYATEVECTTIIVHPSDVTKGKVDERWTHIMWYNK